MFNSLLSGRFDTGFSTILDGTAGTGATGIEALSRGADFVHFADPAREAQTLVQANLNKVKAERTTYRLHNCALDKLPRSDTVMDIVFLDPPYGQNFLPGMVAYLTAQGWADAETLFVLECGRNENPVLPLDVLDRKIYGAAQILYARMPR